MKSVTYLKNHAAELLRELSAGRCTVTITRNGKAQAVMMDVKIYDRWRSAMAVLKLLAQAESDVAVGRAVTQADAFRRARNAIERTAPGHSAPLSGR